MSADEKLLKLQKTIQSTLTNDELVAIVKMLLDYIRWYGVKEISFSETDDFYLKILHKNREIIYDPERSNCPPYVIGSLSEDIEALKKLLNGEYEMPCNLDLERLGAILTALGQTMKMTD